MDSLSIGEEMMEDHVKRSVVREGRGKMSDLNLLHQVVIERDSRGQEIGRRSIKVDNRSVVPYNKALCLAFQAHINVEYCASIHAIKYLHKYIYKGGDRGE